MGLGLIGRADRDELVVGWVAHGLASPDGKEERLLQRLREERKRKKREREERKRREGRRGEGENRVELSRTRAPK